MIRQSLPREIQKWLQSLDLSYSIKNFRRDLANGFTFAEILSRHPEYKVDMRNFNTGNSEESRAANWKMIKKLLKIYNQLPFNADIIDKCINKAPNQGFDTLVNLYKYLTHKEEVYIIRKIDETDKFKQYDLQMPKYMRPTANNILKDNEIERIPDNKTRIDKIKHAMRKHRTFLKKEREDFKNNKSFYMASTKGRNYRNTSMILNKYDSKYIKEERRDIVNNQTESNESKGDFKKEEKTNLMQLLGKDLESSTIKLSNLNNPNPNIVFPGLKVSLAPDYNVEVNFNKILKKYFIDTDHNIELEFNKYNVDDKESKDKQKNYIGFFFNKFSLCSHDKLKRILDVFKEKEILDSQREESTEVLKFIEIISKTLLELDSFLKILTTFIDILYKDDNAFHENSFYEILYPGIRICQGVYRKDKLRCESIFLSYGINTLLQVMSDKPYFRNCLFQIIRSLITNNSFSHLKVLKTIKSKFLTNDLIFYHLITKWIEFFYENTNEDDPIEHDDYTDSEIYNFYLNACHRGIKSNCDIIKSKSINMIIYFIQLKQIDDVLFFSHDIFKLKKSFNWEVLSLVLVYCSNNLIILNTHREIKRIKENEMMRLGDEEGNDNSNIAEINEGDKDMEMSNTNKPNPNNTQSDNPNNTQSDNNNKNKNNSMMMT